MPQSNFRHLRQHIRRLSCVGRIALVVSALASALCATGARAGEPDCDNNGVPDAEELSGNDCNGNGMLDVCENDTLGPAVEFSAGRTLSNPVPTPAFDIDGDVLAIAEAYHQTTFVSRLKIFRNDGSSWNLEQIIDAPTTTLRFSSVVRVAGDRIAVFVYRQSGSPSPAIMIYRYEPASGQWVEEASLPDGGVTSANLFGFDFAFDGSRLVAIERVLGVQSQTHSMRYRCYEREGTTWSQSQIIWERSRSFFSTQTLTPVFVELGDNQLVILEALESVPNLDARYVLSVYHYDGFAWRSEASLHLPAIIPGLGASFGRMSITRDRIAFGVNAESFPNDGTGRLFVFHRIGGEWVEALDVTDADVPGISDIGAWTARDGDRLFSGGYSTIAGNQVSRVFEVVIDSIDASLVERPGLAIDNVAAEVRISGNHFTYIEKGIVTTVYVHESVADCDTDSSLDACEIAGGAPDVNNDRRPDECQVDCNQDGIPDIAQLSYADCDANGVHDECDVDPSDPDGDGYASDDCNANGVPDHCEPDCDDNGIPDDCDLDPQDPDGDGLVASDCNGNGVADACDIVSGVVQMDRLTPSEDVGDGWFGGSLAFDGDLLVVGASIDGRGRAYLYRRDASSWLEEAVLSPSPLFEHIDWGSRVVAANGRVFVSEDDLANSAYRIRVFECVDGIWEITGTIEVGSGFTMMGTAFAVLDDELVCYGPTENVATLHRLQGGVWTPVRQYSSVLQNGHLNRSSIAITEDSVVLGADPGGDNHGAYIHDKEGGPNSLVFPLRTTTRIQGFLTALNQIAVSGDAILVSYPFAQGVNTGALSTGAVDVARRHESGWYRDARLAFEGSPIEQLQGWSLAASGNRAFVGSPTAAVSDGRVRIYQYHRGKWQFQSSIESPDPGQRLLFGSTIAASDRFLAVSSGLSVYTNSAPADADSVIVYSIDLDIDDNGILDTCQTDCDANNYPDEGERTIPGMVNALLHGGAACVFDTNNDGAIDGRDVAGFMNLLLSGP